ncbi:DUF1800 domain-containing protein [Ideonella sp. YS5]|uniref:DUF1800 domain-containing protein n=1 Tax=Ideonella sp. YS5 TaxID=3453714 RepID=UPI003EE895A6
MSSSPAPAPWRLTRLAALLTTICLAACGGGGGDSSTDTDTGVGAGSGDTQTGGQTDGSGGQTSGTDTGGGAGVDGGDGQGVGTTRADAFRLLTQGTFGPTPADITRTISLGAAGWVDEQLAKPAQAVHVARWDADDAAVKLKNPKDTAGAPSVISSFYQQALQADNQLRQRTAFALSEIFVVSLTDLASERGRAVASYQDMLVRNAFGNFRTLLQDVATHPAMGLYLSHMKNRKEDPTVGRVPDQNFAREVMQLFSIGLVQLNNDGTVKLDGNGKAIETYGVADIEGLASVFTGFAWGGPDTLTSRFAGSLQDPNRMILPMQGYPQFHSTLAKSFLGTDVAPQSPANPAASLKAAIDTLFNHPNVGPFISRQLIQRLVTSTPSPAYVGRVAAKFNNNGSGVRGDLKAVVRAILLDDEARSAATAAGAQYGKLREPVLRLTAFLRAFGVKSDSGRVLMTYTDDPGLTLAQTPLRSPSVFNFFRPGYVPPGGEAAAAGMTLPEMQITNEASVAGYANYMIAGVQRGVGQKGADGKAVRPDLQVDYSAFLPLATDPGALVDKVNERLLAGAAVNPTLRSELVAAVGSITIPALRADGSNLALVDKAKANRVWAATALVLVTPEFIVQK